MNSLRGAWVIIRRGYPGRWWTAESRYRVDNDSVTEALELGDEAAGVGLLMPLLQPLGPEVTVGFVAREHVIGADEDGVGGRDLGPFGATPGSDPCCRQTLEERLKAAVKEPQEIAMLTGSYGILVTRNRPGSYTATLSDRVPFGMTRELVQ